MITRYAVFSGRLRAGMKDQMHAYVNQTLAPLWRQFASAETVSVLFEVDRDPAGPRVPLVLAISYADEAAMQRGLENPARYESRDLLPNFYTNYFETIELYHYVMENQIFQSGTKK